MLVACVVLACGGARAHAVGVDMLGISENPCVVYAASPVGAGLGAMSGQGFIDCPGATEQKPVTIQVTGCAQRLDFFRPTVPWYISVDRCTVRTGVITGPGPGSVEDTVPCGSLPMYRTTITATVSGFAKPLYDESEPRPGVCV